jgi:polysaccharide export outer membrane protein
MPTFIVMRGLNVSVWRWLGVLLVVTGLPLLAAGCAGGGSRAASAPGGADQAGETVPVSGGKPVAAPGQQLIPAVMGPPPTGSGDLGTYLIGPRDLLSIRVFKVDELTTEERVNDAGAVVLPLVGAVEVAGLTPDQAEKRIADFLAKDFMHDPQVDLFVKEYANMNVTVGGAVRRPGVFPITGAMTLMQAVARAEGVTDVANDNEVIIFRGQPGKAVTAYVVDLEQVQQGEMIDPLLVSHDKVMVPESGGMVFMRNVTGALRGFVSAPLM